MCSTNLPPLYVKKRRQWIRSWDCWSLIVSFNIISILIHRSCKQLFTLSFQNKIPHAWNLPPFRKFVPIVSLPFFYITGFDKNYRKLHRQKVNSVWNFKFRVKNAQNRDTSVRPVHETLSIKRSRAFRMCPFACPSACHIRRRVERIFMKSGTTFMPLEATHRRSA
jgi:hypothetical protein